ncbi:MAG: hypothetical protein ACOY0T_36835 [Myxococcota bacterium]
MRARARPTAADLATQNAALWQRRRRVSGAVRAAILAACSLVACAVYDPSVLPNVSAQGGNDSNGNGGSNLGGALVQGGVSTAGAASGGAASLSGGVPNAGFTSLGGNSGAGASAGTSTSAGTGGAPQATGGNTAPGGASGGQALGGTSGQAAGGSGQAGAGGSAGSKPVLFSDDFESGVTRWTTNTTGDWKVVTDGSQVFEESTLSATLRTATAGDNAWTDQSVEVRFKILAFGGTSTSYFAGVYARYVDDLNHYCLAVRGDGKYAIRRRVAGSNTTIGSAFSAVPVTVDTWHTLKLEIVGTTLNAYVDGILFHSEVDTSLTQGRAGIGTTNTSARFDDVVVTRP